MSEPSDILARLMAVIEARRDHPRPHSYTCQLLSAGVALISDKILEEAAELVAAAAEPAEAGSPHVVHESADLIYHLLVLLAHRRVRWQQIGDELAHRFGISGLDEKAART